MRALLSLLLLSGCATAPIGHPPHCGPAVEVVKRVIAVGAIAKGADSERVDNLLHQIQLAMYLGGMCPSP